MQVKDGSNGGQGSAKESSNLKNRHDDYLVNWYIGVAKRRGWDVVVHLLSQYPDDEERMKMLIKKKLGK
jgi:hypothetical protein